MNEKSTQTKNRLEARTHKTKQIRGKKLETRTQTRSKLEARTPEIGNHKQEQKQIIGNNIRSNLIHRKKIKN